ncbi:MAG: cytochrome c [SAR202 cluster bacterium]|nr:cytochrome c [SAR202 cluster bacterium]
MASGIMLMLILAPALGCGGSDAESQVTIGETLYAEHCQLCHGDAKSGEGALADVPTHGPDGHTWHHADGQLVDIIIGRLSYRGKKMPAFGGTISDEEAMAILEYFKTGWPAEILEAQQEASKNWNALNP